MYEQYISLLPSNVINLLFATMLGLLIGLEREWAEKSAGIRTTALISLLGGILITIPQESQVSPNLLVVSGSLLVLVFTVLLGVRNLVLGYESLSLTTSVSLFISYGVGVLSGTELYLEAITVAVISSLLLVLKRELHSFAGTISREELRSSVEFAIIAFVVYPILPSKQMGPWNSVNPRVVWLLVVAISGIGFVNYLLVKKYEDKGFAVTGFFGGLVNSTAVVASISEQTEKTGADDLGVGAVLLSNSAMALRNAAIIAIFLPLMTLKIGIPLTGVTLAGIAMSYYVSKWKSNININLSTPFSTPRVLGFGIIFLGVILVSAAAHNLFGGAGFLLTSFISGFVSSGSVTTGAIALAESNTITSDLAVWGVILGTVSSMIAKIGFASFVSYSFGKRVSIWTAALIAFTVVLTAGSVLIL